LNIIVGSLKRRFDTGGNFNGEVDAAPGHQLFDLASFSLAPEYDFSPAPLIRPLYTFNPKITLFQANK
jgi:hypothetical protein